jgi:hypothetical protein
MGYRQRNVLANRAIATMTSIGINFLQPASSVHSTVAQVLQAELGCCHDCPGPRPTDRRDGIEFTTESTRLPDLARTRCAVMCAVQLTIPIRPVQATWIAHPFEGLCGSVS